MLKFKKSSILIGITVLYAILIFYLSVTSDLGDLVHFLKTALGHAARNIPVAHNLSPIMDFLLATFKLVIRASLDPGHVLIYFGLGVLLYLVFLNLKNPKLAKYSALYAICVGTAYGILNEIFQMFLPYRVASMADAMSNLLGLTLAQIFVIIFIFGLREISRIGKTQW